ncbi:MAG TPA: TIGR02680 family protein [Lachnospiraceae bacterium]|nr:TIGR02680 family protein [Lachnospiraceae bacterium]
MEDRKMNSRWQMNRIGLLDFWYYDEEEFYFLDGRMLLRGSNGSGKSVTMQSFIPLLLDGNMRPERLDPFGSNARKMKNYLLEENDVREERTGYLYMEFKRQDTDAYLTIGIGMRARRNKELDTWYFCILDGRRANKDFPLYKAGKTKLSLTKQELKNRIGDGGRVMETQRQYMEMVNKQIFGFDTMEEYKELIDLLIQLRTPKLSKDFKPSILNEILGNSLAPLSEDDLRPMSEAIENMDNLKMDLDGLKESFQAVNKIKREYEKYNQAVLRDKAKDFLQVTKDCVRQEQERKKLEEKLEETQKEHETAKNQVEELKGEQLILEKKKGSLSNSNINELAKDKCQLEEDLQESKRKLQEKEKSYSGKKDQQIDIKNKQKEEEDRAYQFKQEMKESLEEMEAYHENLDLLEFPFMKRDLTDSPWKEYDYGTHQSMVAKLQEQLEKGKQKLEEMNLARQKYDDVLKQLEDSRIRRDKCETTYYQTDNQLTEIKNELVEKIHRWNQENQYLLLTSNALQQMEGMIQVFSIEHDFEDVKKLMREQFFQVEKNFKNELYVIERNLQDLQEVMEQTKVELKEWEGKTDPEPECQEEVKENRKQLEEKEIPFTPFYKLVDFKEELSEERANRFEEALLQMGILNALIIPKEYQEDVLKMKGGTCDRYLFGDASKMKENLHFLFSVDCSSDSAFYQQVTDILGEVLIVSNDQMAHMMEDSTAIAEDGTYRIGIVTGTITGTYTAKYIGANAREQFRKEMVEKLTRKLAQEKEEETVLLESQNKKKAQLEKLSQEQARFPKDVDLRVAIKALEDVRHALDRSQAEVKQQEEKEQQEAKNLKDIRTQAQELADKVHLVPNLDIFKEALEDSRQYQQAFHNLQMSHNKYQNSYQNLQTFSEQLENVQQDLEELLGDLNMLKNAEKQLKAQLQSVTEQLDIQGYEELKAELEQCINRLHEIPKELEQYIRSHEKLENEIRQTQQSCERILEKIKQTKEEVNKAEEMFLMELQLQYVSLENDLTQMSCMEKASCCLKEIDASFEGRTEEFQQKLQNVFYENKSALNDYNLSLEPAFTVDSGEGTIGKRLDIKAKYQYASVSFLELAQRMERAIEEKENILSEKDRELFEDILANTVSRKIRGKIYKSMEWVNKMNEHMGKMRTSSGLTLSLKWKPKRAEHEGQLDTSKLVELLKQDTEIMREEEFAKLSSHFRSKIAEARKVLEQKENVKSFHMIVKEVLDYRKWFEFTLECKKTGENKKELTNRVFFTFSGGEKAMSMYVPLFSAVASKYDGARTDAPRLISLDEAFAGVDEMNIKDMFRLMVEFEFNFIINSQILYGDYETVPSLAIYQLLRPGNVKYVSIISYVWNGKQREYVESVGERVEQQS